MADQPQTESGADVNALRNNFQVGESKELMVKNVEQISADVFVVTAEVEDGDKDTDNCTLAADAGEWKPTAGEMAMFKRTEQGLEISAVKA